MHRQDQHIAASGLRGFRRVPGRRLRIAWRLAALACLLVWAATLRAGRPHRLIPSPAAWTLALLLAGGLYAYLRGRRTAAGPEGQPGPSFEGPGRLIPVCAVCKKVRNDHGSWEEGEAFIHPALGSSLTHGYCPECYEAARKEIAGLPPRRS